MTSYRTNAADWQCKAYLDLGAGMGLAGYACHLRFNSPSLNQTLHGIFYGLGVGLAASVNLHGLYEVAEKALGLGDVTPSVGQDMKTICLRPFSASDLALSVASVATAGVAAIAAPADCKVIQIGTFCQVVEAKATIKLAVGVGSSWVAGNFMVIWSNGPRAELPMVTAERMRKKASDPLYLGSMKM